MDSKGLELLFTVRHISHSPPYRVCRTEQAAPGDQEHSQAGPGDRGAAPSEGALGGGQGHPEGPSG